MVWTPNEKEKRVAPRFYSQEVKTLSERDRRLLLEEQKERLRTTNRLAVDTIQKVADYRNAMKTELEGKDLIDVAKGQGVEDDFVKQRILAILRGKRRC
jgi:hypothetical protein